VGIDSRRGGLGSAGSTRACGEGDLEAVGRGTVIELAAAAAARLAGDQLLFFSRVLSPEEEGEFERDVEIQDFLARLLRVPVTDLVMPFASATSLSARLGLPPSSSSAARENLAPDSLFLVFLDARRNSSLLACLPSSVTLEGRLDCRERTFSEKVRLMVAAGSLDMPDRWVKLADRGRSILPFGPGCSPEEVGVSL
jgi:hypothetical protein